jgi:hypothetical protein
MYSVCGEIGLPGLQLPSYYKVAPLSSTTGNNDFIPLENCYIAYIALVEN